MNVRFCNVSDESGNRKCINDSNEPDARVEKTKPKSRVDNKYQPTYGCFYVARTGTVHMCIH